ncbi:C25 family cysteine peptidase [Cyclobacterium sp. 1_MG-2023]|uniref:putative type IX secretion system sortase PorU2 n=1 Tax=Cyclobacterium sp. 1_MG-2023 TaxID=3062681 RepID=UPI0026E251E2|nr:C25 family cysteine peptidase [Cyclobacterium sp. 1_MG-2023]MDO6439470.1 C25 family cysteine peptidase [Cyclobacterium sp. 1_MG-2023]
MMDYRINIFMALRMAFLLVGILLHFFVSGQSNDWLNYDRDYYKIPTSSDGIYRLSYTTLSASGLSVDDLDPREIKVYHRGEEVSVYISGQEDGSFDQNDYLEFIGKRNDGTLDKLLYEDESWMTNPHYNTHNDTTAFFLTIDPGNMGKRISAPAAGEGLEQVDTYELESLQHFAEQYALGREYFPGVHLSVYDQGQGWTSATISRGRSRTLTFESLGQVVEGNANPVLELSLGGRSETSHKMSVEIGPTVNNLRELGQYTFEEFENYVLVEQLEQADFSAGGECYIRVTSMGVDNNLDNISINYAQLNYSSTGVSGDFEVENITFSEGNKALVINNVNEEYTAYNITDISNPIRLEVKKTGADLYLPTGATAGQVLIQNQENIVELNVLEKVRFRDLLNQPANFIIISHKLLREPADNYGDPVGAYAAYRATPVGGGFDTLTVNVQDLYNQFSYGEKSPLGIRRFLALYQEQYVPENILLVGRAYGIFNTKRSSGITYFYRDNPAVFSFQELVPTFGYPYSDNRFVIGLDPSKPLERNISVGRIPARTPNDVAAYLDKIKEKDALGVSETWQKDLIHLSGGRSAFELERFYNFLNGFKVIAEDVYLGGNVETVRKRSNETTELINISDQINAGLSLVTFFGHAAPSTTDIDIGFVSVNEMGYRNKGKYPILLLNGCDAGNAFGDAYTFGEDWIITPERGASNFLAHADVGIDVYLRRFSESFYTTAFADSSMIYQNLGKVKLQAEKLFYSRYGDSEVNQSHANQIIMLGDPAARIFPANKADYAVYADDIELGGVNDQVLNSLSDTLELSLPIRNLGIVDLDEVDVDVSRQLPDGTLITLPTNTIPPVFRLDTLVLSIPNSGINSFGDNLFTITINKGKEIEEMTYANNTVSVSFFVPLSGTLNLFPLDFGIVNEREVELIAQIPGLATEQRNLTIQLDTASDFSSPRRKEVRITTSNLARWKVNLFEDIPQADSLTFYWRTKFSTPREGEDVSWKGSSFSYIENGPEGWTQRKLPQFLDNQLSNLSISVSDQQWQFQETALNIDVFTFGSENEDYSVENTQIMLNGVAYILDTFNRFCKNGTLGLMAFDHQTLEPYLPVPLVTIDVLDSRSCGRVPQVIQSISNANITGEGNTMLLDFVDGMKEDDYVIIFSVGEVTFSDWPDEAYIKLKELGANEATLRNLVTGDPYILFGKKGMRPGEAIEVVPTTDDEIERDSQVISFETDIQGYFPTGNILSPKVGPASDWISFFNEVRGKDLFQPENSSMDVLGVTPDGGEVSLLQDVTLETMDLTGFDASSYPYLRLRYSLEDLPDQELPQLAKWQVDYTGVPEGVLILNDQRSEVILDEGEADQLTFEFINISKHDFLDSIQVDYSFLNVDQRKVTEHTFKIPAVKGGESTIFTIDFDSKGNGGNNSLNVFVNPRILTEQVYRNNVMDLPEFYKVNGDDLNPVLDVNFDGKYIMNGDIVSPTVIISAKVKDENKIALKQDTTGMELMLRAPCETCEFEKISFSNERVKWFPATDNADFTIEFQPGPLDDGIYTLKINASDAAGNMAGSVPYEVSFEVINESQITNFYPYPNPFSSSVRFVFTVTGAEIPDEIKIQIMTITGKVVKEIFQDELGPVSIGNNITEYAWDGKDEFGDQLANGVYIYRVMVRKNGQFMEHRNTSGDKAFKKGYGKMYLLR